MSEKPQKPVSLFRQIAGLFYRFDDQNSVPQISDRAKSQSNVPQKVSQKTAAQAQTESNEPEHGQIKSTEVVTAKKQPVKESITLKGEAEAAPTQDTDTGFPFPKGCSVETTEEPESLKTFETPKRAPQTIVAGDSENALEQPASKPKYPSIVTFRNVTKVFNPGTPNEFMALKNISFEIEDLPDVGEFIALVGPSGCGKSTVLNLIQGFQEVGPPTYGEVLVRNKPVTGPGRDRGMIFQKYSSFPHLTVLQNVMFGLQLNRESLGYPEQVMEKLAREMIAKVGMKGHEDKYPYQLSGGQQQRVAIARTLVLKPRIILMDEPFSALDEPTRIEMQQLITSLWHEVEATVFIVTHSLAEAVFLSDRIFMFQANPGRLTSQIAITREMIGKYEGMSPLEVQESPKFNHFLKEITDEFLRIGGSD
jgi:ABC-type nitrate/sulfonate/bicarbonate transport system ATPase subunit